MQMCSHVALTSQTNGINAEKSKNAAKIQNKYVISIESDTFNWISISLRRDNLTYAHVACAWSLFFILYMLYTKKRRPYEHHKQELYDKIKENR